MSLLNPSDMNNTQTYNPLVFANESDEIKEISKILVSSSDTSMSANDSFWHS